jgi:hypothetical protein
MHPAHKAALEKAKAAKQMRQDKLDTIRDLRDNHGIKFLCRPTTEKLAGLSIAYRPVLRNVVEFSTSVCHPVDKFDKLEGQCNAAANFMAGKTVQFRHDGVAPIHKAMKYILSTMF